ncbi:unnamed protein product [Rhizophagus irregularis]|nr:unnamed protein product [Rhizophagus irregularis]
MVIPLKSTKIMVLYQDDQYKNNTDEYNDVTDGLLYGLDEIQVLISKQFQSAEELNEPVKLAFEIELNSKLIEDIFSELQPDTSDLETIKRSFYQLVNVLLFSCIKMYLPHLPVVARPIFKWQKKFTGNATADDIETLLT